MQKKLTQFSKNKFVQGGVYFSLANIAIGFLNYLFNSLSAKFLGPAKYSEITALFSYIVIFSTPFMAIGPLIIRRIGYADKNKIIVGQGIENWFFAKFKKYSFLLIPYLFLIFVIPRITNLAFMTSLTLLILIVLGFIGSLYRAIIQGYQLFLAASVIGIITVIIKIIGPLLIPFTSFGLKAVFFFLILSSLMAIYLTKKVITKSRMVFLKNSLNNNYKKYKLEKRILEIISSKETIITFLSLLGIALLSNIDIIFVKKFFTPEQTGLYGAWSLFAKIILYVLGPLIAISFIFFTDKEQKKKHRFILLGITFLFSIAGLIAFLGYKLLGRVFIEIVFNEKYLSILTYLPQAAVFGTLYTLLTFLNNFFIAKKNKVSLIVFIASPLYFFALFFFGKSFKDIVNINIYYSLILVILYLFYAFKSKPIKLIKNI